MADTATPPAETPPAETPPVAPAPDATQTPPEQALGDAGKAALDAERKARRDAERQAKTLSDQLKAYEDAGKSEIQKAADRATAAEQAAQEWQQRYTGTTIRTAVVEAAVAARAIDPTTVHALIKDAVTIGDDGTPQGVDKLVADLQKSKPFLFNPAPGGRDAHAGAAGTIPNSAGEQFADFLSNQRRG